MQKDLRETATMSGRSPVNATSQFERIKRARAARPDCCKCNARPAAIFRFVMEQEMVIGLCKPCEGSNGARESRSLAEAGRRSLDHGQAVPTAAVAEPRSIPRCDGGSTRSGRSLRRQCCEGSRRYKSRHRKGIGRVSPAPGRARALLNGSRAGEHCVWPCGQRRSRGTARGSRNCGVRELVETIKAEWSARPRKQREVVE